MTTETLRAAYATATIAHETAARAAYVAEMRGGRGVGLAKAREAKAWARLCAARRDAWIEALEHDLHAAEGPLDAAESA